MPAWTWRVVFFTPAFRSLLAACGAHASGGTGLLWRDRANPGAPTLSLAYPQTVHNPSSNRKTDTGLCRETTTRSEEHTSELQSPDHLVCRLLLDKNELPVHRLLVDLVQLFAYRR